MRRAPMDGAARVRFLRRYGLGLALLVFCYVLVTAIRDFRDNFAAEIWTALGFGHAAAVFTASELPVAFLSLTVLAVIIVVRDNTKALLVIHGVVMAGLFLLGASTLAFQAGLLSPLLWMILSGAGLYMAYVPFNAMLFDRLIAASDTVGSRRIPNLCGRCLRLSGQLRSLGLAQPRPDAAELAAGVHGRRLRHQRRRSGSDGPLGAYFLRKTPRSIASSITWPMRFAG